MLRDFGITDINFDVNDTGGTWEFWIEFHLLNDTGRIPNSLKLQLGFGTADDFVNSYAGDELDFDGPIPDDGDLPHDANHRFVRYQVVDNERDDRRVVLEGWQWWDEDEVSWTRGENQRWLPSNQVTQKNVGAEQGTFFVVIDIPDFDRDRMPQHAQTANGYRFTLRLQLN
ncbi:hypothetical protein HRbin36_00588 [bacterium HR36]|nr:hypothetical protein HRbin36_00588 [bacterium HR36]